MLIKFLFEGLQSVLKLMVMVGICCVPVRAQEIMVNCEKGKPVAEIQSDGKIKIRCVVENSPPGGEIPPTTPPDKPTEPGTSTGQVWIATPENFQSLIGNGSPARAGDTIRLTPGTYLPPTWGNYKAFKYQLDGQPGKPITVEGVPGAILDGRESAYGLLYLEGSWGVFRWLEITNTDPDRTKERGTSAVEIQGDYHVFTQNRIHKVGTAVFAGQSAKATEISYNVVYDCGWQRPGELNHGNGLYLQNDGSTIKRVIGNVVLGVYGTGIQLYGRQGAATGYELIDNVVAHSGLPSKPDTSDERNLVMGGSKTPTQNFTATGNFFFHGLDRVNSANVFLGYQPGNGAADFRDNYIIGGSGIYVIDWSAAAIVGNTFIAKERLMTLDATDWTGIKWAGNRYYSPGGRVFATQSVIAGENGLPVRAFAWDDWRDGTKETGTFNPLPTQPVFKIYAWGMAVWNPTSIPFVYAPLPGKRAIDPVTRGAVKECASSAFCVVKFE